MLYGVLAAGFCPPMIAAKDGPTPVKISFCILHLKKRSTQKLPCAQYESAQFAKEYSKGFKGKVVLSEWHSLQKASFFVQHSFLHQFNSIHWQLDDSLTCFCSLSFLDSSVVEDVFSFHFLVLDVDAGDPSVVFAPCTSPCKWWHASFQCIAFPRVSDLHRYGNFTVKLCDQSQKLIGVVTGILTKFIRLLHLGGTGGRLGWLVNQHRDFLCRTSPYVPCFYVRRKRKRHLKAYLFPYFCSVSFQAAVQTVLAGSWDSLYFLVEKNSSFLAEAGLSIDFGQNLP